MFLHSQEAIQGTIIHNDIEKDHIFFMYQILMQVKNVPLVMEKLPAKQRRRTN